jgi:hypothetical protein
MAAWPHALGENIMVAGVCDRGTSLPHARQEAEREEETWNQT